MEIVALKGVDMAFLVVYVLVLVLCSAPRSSNQQPPSSGELFVSLIITALGCPPSHVLANFRSRSAKPVTGNAICGELYTQAGLKSASLLTVEFFYGRTCNHT